MTSDIQTQIDRAKNIIRNSPRGPYKRIPSASTDHKMIGIPDNTAPGGDRAIASALIYAGDRDAEAMAAYIVGSADPHHGWNAMIDALITARGAVAPVHSMTIDPHGDARARARARLIAAVNEEAEFVKPDVNFESVIDTAITRLGVLTRERRRALDERAADRRKRVLAPGTVSDAPIPESQPAPEPDSSPLDRDSIDADHRLLIYAGGKMRVVPLPLAIAGTCSAMRQLAAAIADDGGLGCNGDGEDHDWIEVRAEAPSVGEIDPDSAQVPW